MDIFDRVMINVGITGWVVLAVKAWAQVAAWVEPQIYFTW